MIETMFELRSLKELFHIVKEYHMFFNEKGLTIYMCHAADYAHIAGNISEKERDLFKDACMELVHSYHKNSYSLESALMRTGVLNGNSTVPSAIRLIENTWNEYFKTSENQDG